MCLIHSVHCGIQTHSLLSMRRMLDSSAKAAAYARTHLHKVLVTKIFEKCYFNSFFFDRMKVPQMLNDDDSTRQAWSPGQSWQAGQAWQGWQGCCGMTEPEVVHYNDSGLIVNECR